MSGISQSLSLLVLLAIYFYIDLALIAKYDKKRRDNSRLDLSLYNFITVIIPLLIILQPVLLPCLSLRISTWWFVVIQVFGLVLSSAGFVFLIWARLHFVRNMNPAPDGQYYAEYTEVQEDHPIVTSGPYALIRHPVYASFFTIAFGVVLVNPSVTTALILFYTLVDFTRSTKKEEALLLEKAPGYAEYMNEPPRFFPRIKRGDEPILQIQCH